MEVASTGHRGQKSAEPISGLNPDAIDEEKGDVCQTPATTNKKEPACLAVKQTGVPIDRVTGGTFYIPLLCFREVS